MTRQLAPYFLVGSPRSGTKIFRDTLDAFPKITTTDHPLEELWTVGQESSKHEAYPRDSLTQENKNHLREEFKKRQPQDKIFLEKNVRHSLRIPYVREVFPEAKFIHIIRDPRDVIVSLKKRWQNPIDWDYYLSTKALELSLRDIIRYTLRLGGKFLKRILRGEKHVDIWGPHYPGLKADLETKSLLQICALQWKHCVTRARNDGRKSPDTYYEVRYESLMNNPTDALTKLAEFLDLSSPEPGVEFGEKNFRTDSIGRWKNELTSSDLETIKRTLGNRPEQFDYERDWA